MASNSSKDYDWLTQGKGTSYKYIVGGKMTLTKNRNL